jgi:phosphoenolpyruvate synthase/pyruvate phosphate dikinase
MNDYIKSFSGIGKHDVGEGRTIAEKTRMITLGDKGAVEIPVLSERQTQPCLSDEEIRTLASIGKRIEAHFQAPQDIEWGFAEDAPEYPPYYFLDFGTGYFNLRSLDVTA